MRQVDLMGLAVNETRRNREEMGGKEAGSAATRFQSPTLTLPADRDRLTKTQATPTLTDADRLEQYRAQLLIGRREKTPTPKTRVSIWTLLRTPGRFTTRPLPVYFTTKMSVVRPFWVLSKDKIGL